MDSNRLKIRRGKLMNWCMLLCIMALMTVSCKPSKNSKTASADLVIKTARSFTGVPYAFGGTSRSGMDCSGLLLRSFEAIDLQIPRTSTAQSKIGKKVTIGELRKGDLVFFKAEGGKKKVMHVGMVTEVRGKDDVRFIHSSTKLGVIENNIHSDYYRKIFLQARRIL